MSVFWRALALEELPTDRGRCVTIGGREIALFRVDDEVFAIDNSCPHRGGPLAEGDRTGIVIYCPLHAWSFDLRTGVSPSNPRARVQNYAVRIVDGQVEVELPEAASAELEFGSPPLLRDPHAPES